MEMNVDQKPGVTPIVGTGKLLAWWADCSIPEDLHLLWVELDVVLR